MKMKINNNNKKVGLEVSGVMKIIKKMITDLISMSKFKLMKKGLEKPTGMILTKIKDSIMEVLDNNKINSKIMTLVTGEF